MAIILTGYQELNKFMGTEVYTSNDQLGGVKIMHTNGATHLTAKNHLPGIYAILERLSFVPAVRRGRLPIRDLTDVDEIERTVNLCPKDKSTQYDPCALLAGKVGEATGKWVSGLMDKDSFRETDG
ncbi:hypothetical protein DVH05_017110 [Phytophthora capsici]|nr:hypothetical protein DVH05_009474 [Phytophthora capsici]KAG1710103.1 hypothetical protein DVH05_017110 [Phytophthora capsici]